MGKKKIDWSGFDLDDLYTIQGLSTNEIAEEVGCKQSTVFYRLKKLGIETRMSNTEKGVLIMEGLEHFLELDTADMDYDIKDLTGGCHE